MQNHGHPPIGAFFSTWHFDLLALLVVLAAGGFYVVGMVRYAKLGHRWPIINAIWFLVGGLGGFVWIQFGFLGTYSQGLRFAFITRIALLLFAIPMFANLGKPLALAQLTIASSSRKRLNRALASWPIKLLSNAIFAPLLALAVFMLFVSPVSAAWRLSPVAQELTTLLTPALGLIMVLPFAGQAKHRTSLFITAEFMLAFAELMLDAIPGVVLSISNVLLDGAKTLVAGLPAWAPLPLHDQHIAGNLLWGIAELADVPILVALFIRWNRSDKSDAKKIDELTDEQMDELLAAHLRGPRR